MHAKLREIRAQSGLSQAQMAAKLGICKQYYSQIELGQRRLSYNMAAAIAEVFGVTPDAIFLPLESALRVHGHPNQATGGVRSA